METDTISFRNRNEKEFIERSREYDRYEPDSFENKIPVSNTEDIAAVLRPMLKEHAAEINDAHSNGIENPVEDVLLLSKTVFVTPTGNNQETARIVRTRVTIDDLGFSINVAMNPEMIKSFLYCPLEVSPEVIENLFASQPVFILSTENGKKRYIKKVCE